MEIRKPKQVKDIIAYIKDVWQLSVIEEDVLDSVLTLFARQNIEQLKYLLTYDTEDVLDSLDKDIIIKYAKRELDLIDSTDEEDLVDALNDLNYKFIEEVEEDEMISYLEDNGYEILIKESSDIIFDSQKEELNNYFESLSFLERAELLNKIKNANN